MTVEGSTRMAVSSHKTARLVVELAKVGRLHCVQQEHGTEVGSDPSAYHHSKNMRHELAGLSTFSLPSECSSRCSSSTLSCVSVSEYMDERNVGEIDWEGPVDDEDEEMDRSRAAATAELPDDHIAVIKYRWSIPVPSALRTQSVLEEMDHPALTGPVGALYGYTASEADASVLERAYDMARRVAGTRQDVEVVFDACRIALAAGYVHSLKLGGAEVARDFAVDHSLPRLAQSLKHYWSREELSDTPGQDADWEHCMLSMLEVLSSISLITEENDILHVMDEHIGTGFTQAIGVFCELSPSVIQDYPDIGKECLRRHQAALEASGHRNVRLQRTACSPNRR